MMTKIYALAWLMVVAAAGLAYLTASFNELLLTVFGFIFAGLAAVGIVVVLPWWVDRHYSWNYGASQ